MSGESGIFLSIAKGFKRSNSFYFFSGEFGFSILTLRFAKTSRLLTSLMQAGTGKHEGPFCMEISRRLRLLRFGTFKV